MFMPTGLIRYNLTIKIHFRIKYIAVKQYYEAKPIAKETRVRLMDIMLSGSF